MHEQSIDHALYVAEEREGNQQASVLEQDEPAPVAAEGLTDPQLLPIPSRAIGAVLIHAYDSMKQNIFKQKVT
jgi:hypothetical protein